MTLPPTNYDFARQLCLTLRSGLRQLEEHEASLKALQEALIAGEQSGKPKPLKRDAFLKKMHTKHVKF